MGGVSPRVVFRLVGATGRRVTPDAVAPAVFNVGSFLSANGNCYAYAYAVDNLVPAADLLPVPDPPSPGFVGPLHLERR